MKSIKTLQCLNLKKMWMCSSCAKLVSKLISMWIDQALRNLKYWTEEMKYRQMIISYNIHQWKMKQFPRFYEADRQIQIFRVFVMIMHDKYKWSAKMILFKTGILVDFWMNFVDILWFLCGHFAWFWLGTHLRASFPIICPWKSIKIQQKLGVKSRHPVEDKQIILWKSE